MINDLLIPIIGELANVVFWVIMVQFVLGLLMSFNVVNYSNKFVYSLYTSLNAILDPILRPIRKRMPDTGAIDFSPMVLMLLISILMRILYFYGSRFP
jgi:YggT family protein